MNRLASLLALALLAGCCSPDIHFDRPPTTGEPWDTTYLIDLDPNAVTVAQLTSHAATLEPFMARSTVEGVLWPTWRSDPSLTLPDQWTDGADSGIFTGLATGTAAFRYGRTRTDADLTLLRARVRALYLLTHITGTRGVICRCAFPASQGASFGYPGPGWGHRVDAGFVHTSSATVPDPIGGGTFQPFTYYTRATKDQLTGILFGLGAALHVLAPADVPPAQQASATQLRQVIAQTAVDIHHQLVAYHWNIRDEHGRNETNADHVDGLLRLQLYAILRATDPGTWGADYQDSFDGVTGCTWLEWFNRFGNWDQYYAHNLRVIRTFTVWLLEDAAGRTAMRDYSEACWWRFVQGQRSAWFEVVWSVMDGASSSPRARASLQSLYLKPTRLWSSPYWGQEQAPGFFAALWNCTAGWVIAPHLRKPTDYWVWQKQPWDVGGWLDKEGRQDTSGLSFLLPWHLGRFFGVLP